MHARLIARTGPLDGKSFEIEDEAVIGRLPENQISLGFDVVSGRHARIFFSTEERCYFLEDLGSRNGTFVGGIRVLEPERLGPLEIIDIADSIELIFQVPQPDKSQPDGTPRHEATHQEREFLAVPPALGQSAAPPASTRLEASPVPLPSAFAIPEIKEFQEEPPPPASSPPAPAPSQPSPAPSQQSPSSSVFARPRVEQTRMDHGTIPLPPRLGGLLDEGFKAPSTLDFSHPPSPEPAPPTDSRYTLEVQLEDGGTNLIALAEGTHLVGRSEGCEVFIDHPTLSREHARLTVGAQSVHVEDLASTNQTLVKGLAISVETALKAGVLVTFGGVEARLLRNDSRE